MLDMIQIGSSIVVVRIGDTFSDRTGIDSTLTTDSLFPVRFISVEVMVSNTYIR